MRTIELDGVTYKLPQQWSEIKPDQLPRLIRLVYMTPENGAMYHQLLQALLGIHPKAWKKIHRKHFGPGLLPEVRKKNAVVLHDLLGLCKWVWETPMNQQPFAKLSVDGADWLLPEADFASMSYGELTDLYVHLHAYIEQTEVGEGELDYLVATACRPARPAVELTQADWNGDGRELYNEFMVRQRVKRLGKVAFEQKMAVLLYVASTIQAVLGRYRLFDARPGLAPAPGEKASSGEEYIGQGWVKNAHLLAEKHVFGTLRQTQQANAHEVLLFLEEYRSDQREHKADEQH